VSEVEGIYASIKRSRKIRLGYRREGEARIIAFKTFECGGLTPLFLVFLTRKLAQFKKKS